MRRFLRFPGLGLLGGDLEPLPCLCIDPGSGHVPSCTFRKDPCNSCSFFPRPASVAHKIPNSKHQPPASGYPETISNIESPKQSPAVGATAPVLSFGYSTLF